MKKIKIYEFNDRNTLIANVNNFIENLKVYDIKFCVTLDEGFYRKNWYHCMIIYENYEEDE